MTIKILCLGEKDPLEVEWDLAGLSTLEGRVSQDRGGSDLGDAANLLTGVYFNCVPRLLSDFL